jgi:hypothetical protein
MIIDFKEFKEAYSVLKKIIHPNVTAKHFQ